MFPYEHINCKRCAKVQAGTMNGLFDIKSDTSSAVFFLPIWLVLAMRTTLYIIKIKIAA